MLNEVVNPYVFPLFEHKSLLFQLLTVCSTKPQRYKWLKIKSHDSPHTRTIELIQRHYNYSRRQAKDALKLLSVDAILDMAEQHGYQKEQIVKLKAELAKNE